MHLASGWVCQVCPVCAGVSGLWTERGGRGGAKDWPLCQSEAGTGKWRTHFLLGTPAVADCVCSCVSTVIFLSEGRARGRRLQPSVTGGRPAGQSLLHVFCGTLSPAPSANQLCVCACSVEVWPEEGQSLGLSIVGGRHIIKRLKNGEELKGIFIKQVLPHSPAARTQCLKTGDKILEVGSTAGGPDPVWDSGSLLVDS